ncbi:putative peroxygenase 4 [Castilleja foliolosa]|uniref:Peroxygenase 4 n=1 Tax=Castilleja foliolosa TaxID=1961234 RepID=A0ABD3D4R6_9LAMI
MAGDPKPFSISTDNITHEGMENQDQSNILKKHVMFFDRNHDGVIYPSETFEGFRAIGCGVLLSSVAAVFINLGLSGKTRPGKHFSIHFPIEVENIKLAKHGSDSGVYDKEGRFVSSKFEEIFAKHAQTHPGALTSNELKNLLKSNREQKDYGGWLAAFTEWKILYHLCKDENGLLHKDVIRAAYDGSLFERMEKEKASKKQKISSNVG